MKSELLSIMPPAQIHFLDSIPIQSPPDIGKTKLLTVKEDATNLDPQSSINEKKLDTVYPLQPLAIFTAATLKLIKKGDLQKNRLPLNSHFQNINTVNNSWCDAKCPYVYGGKGIGYSHRCNMPCTVSVEHGDGHVYACNGSH